MGGGKEIVGGKKEGVECEEMVGGFKGDVGYEKMVKVIERLGDE